MKGDKAKLEIIAELIEARAQDGVPFLTVDGERAEEILRRVAAELAQDMRAPLQ